MDQLFKVFYSWQSDLSGNKTRYFIQEIIDTAIRIAQQSEKIEAERDEAIRLSTVRFFQTLQSRITRSVAKTVDDTSLTKKQKRYNRSLSK